METALRARCRRIGRDAAIFAAFKTRRKLGHSTTKPSAVEANVAAIRSMRRGNLKLRANLLSQNVAFLASVPRMNFDFCSLT
eukprot:CAMPEP_0172720960 /NCGR_PEP_ID=MMETSP1074-20121228/78060_1 /TAXON_ID=2916 /ORGANISM="Ceratium fusus, Strain PA161109" /LENGTH=81 /DNA_ID=CAMNT_0013546587 /DNA_START=190 /DNA_END=431 /DNA_ORIENTATION=+